VAASGSRWRDLIEALPRLPLGEHAAAIERLETLDTVRLQAADRAAIWNALRTLISQHRSFADANWALPRERVDQIEDVYRRFEPEDPVARYAWLFADRPEIPEGLLQDLTAYQARVARERLEAVRSVHARTGLGGVVDLGRHVERPETLGFALGQSELVRNEEDEFLGQHLAATDAHRARLARGFVAGRMWGLGREWTEAKLARGREAWTPAQAAEVLVCLPYDERTWDLSEGLGPDTDGSYWRLVTPYGISNAGYVERATRKLLEHGRPYTAIDLLGLHAGHLGGLPPELIADALERAVRMPWKDDPPSSSFSYHASALVGVLEDSDGIEPRRVAAIEWALLPLFGHHEARPRVLHRELAENPAFFVEVIALAYRAEGAKPRELSEDDRTRARHSAELLWSWRGAPGSIDNTIDADALRRWVDQAGTAAAAIGRGPITDQLIGQVLSGSPSGSDGVWPHQAVRDLVEEIASEELERGFEVGRYNRRGVVTKAYAEGGAQERQLADQYAGFAAAIRDRWPRTASMLRRMAESYRADARGEDHSAQLREDLDR